MYIYILESRPFWQCAFCVFFNISVCVCVCGSCARLFFLQGPIALPRYLSISLFLVYALSSLSLSISRSR